MDGLSLGLLEREVLASPRSIAEAGLQEEGGSVSGRGGAHSSMIDVVGCQNEKERALCTLVWHLGT